MYVNKYIIFIYSQNKTNRLLCCSNKTDKKTESDDYILFIDLIFILFIALLSGSVILIHYILLFTYIYY